MNVYAVEYTMVRASGEIAEGVEYMQAMTDVDALTKFKHNFPNADVTKLWVETNPSPRWTQVTLD